MSPLDRATAMLIAIAFAAARRFAAARAGGVLVAHDASGAVGRAFGTVGVPESYLVDSMGVVRWHAQGELRGAIPSLRRALAALR